MQVQDPLRQQVDAKLRQLIDSDSPHFNRSYDVLLLGAAYRLAILKEFFVNHYQFKVQLGPFQGMQLLKDVSDGCFLPKLFGSYESTLHPYIERACGKEYEAVVNIGSAEGYYSIGFARRLPTASIHAYDIDPRAQHFCKEMAHLNSVQDRVTIKDRFDGRMFEDFAGQRSLIFCDIEGAEIDLLNPEQFPALERMDLIVEIHSGQCKDATDIIRSRFSRTHDVVIVDNQHRQLSVPPGLTHLSELDQFMILWEARREHTPWAIMTAR
ncbi:hypothetical protein HL658_32040 [Azospirillum sp. RWY-5-1]|uniref:Methyltransferase FkbM domain-containing protein n=1 Tax=Azospirillum oleiclasticum TaxID=2735135 RepID=A0ABX2TIF4_9PROT|nr:50S ribosomal protein L11 methyltransferase [Azospirillum oleiclasticum]NYZ17200.1 hypothetical protein [Azospirillum oleiclasticum]NYZ23091.1 hypothetical protein [Azospirillum oleiclasticum]